MSKANFTTDVFTAAYPSIHKKNEQGNYPSNKYEVTGYLTQAENAESLMVIAQAIKTVAAAKFGDLPLEQLTSTGMKEEDDGRIKVKFTSNYKPRLQNAGGGALGDDIIISPGDLIRVSGKAEAWEMKGRKGVSLYFSDVRLVEAVERVDPFGGPEDGFEEQTADEPAISF